MQECQLPDAKYLHHQYSFHEYQANAFLPKSSQGHKKHSKCGGYIYSGEPLLAEKVLCELKRGTLL